MRREKYKIKYVNYLPDGFIGMNYYAAKEHGYIFRYPKRTILILRRLPTEIRLTTINHEIEEIMMMKYKHHKYKKAHKIALEMEEYDPEIKEGSVIVKVY